jgi:hypothetical protein
VFGEHTADKPPAEGPGPAGDKDGFALQDAHARKDR